MNSLVFDNMVEIFSFLPYDDIMNISTVSKSFNDVCNFEQLWKNIYESKFNGNDKTNYKEIVLINYLNLNNLSISEKLIYAIKNNFYNLVKHIFTNYSTTLLNLENESSYIYIAAESGDLRIVKYIFNNYKQYCCCNGLSVYIATKTGRTNILQYLIENGYDYTSYNLFNIAARYNHLSTINYLIKIGVKIKNSYCGVTPLYIACQKGYYDIAKIIILHDSSIINLKSKNNMTCLHVACRNNHYQIIKLLLESNANINDVTYDNMTPLHIACEYGNYECVKIILDTPTINKDLLFQYNPMYIVAKNNNLNILKLLIEKYPDYINRTFADSSTPLYIACQNGNIDIAAYLFENGANSTIKYNSYTPLFLACQKNNIQIVKILLADVMSINEVNKNGNIPLHVALNNGYEDLIKLLIRRGSDLSIKNNNGKSCMDIINGSNKYLRVYNQIIFSERSLSNKRKNDDSDHNSNKRRRL
jgi:ankyrin repeat protein